MKKWLMVSFCIAFVSCMIVSKTCFAWQELWTKAVLNCKEKNYNEAENFFNAAVIEMEIIKDEDHPYVYVDRARLHLLLDHPEKVLLDIDKALSSDKLPLNEKVRAIVTRLMAKSKLGMDQGVLEDLKYFAKINKDKMPMTEITNEYVISRNIPDCECYREIMTNYYIQSGICESEKDIDMTSSGICIVRKKPNCSCNFNSECEKKEESSTCRFRAQSVTQESILDCKKWCDRMAIGGAAWCSKSFKKTWCQVACATAVYEIQQGCYWCCSGGNFYQKCVKPFEDIVSQMGNVCDPAWD
jgi:hypothetical protein